MTCSPPLLPPLHLHVKDFCGESRGACSLPAPPSYLLHTQFMDGLLRHGIEEKAEVGWRVRAMLYGLTTGNHKT